MEKRYQVFLSSTYEDLKEERLEVMKAILELDCFPVGMEYFPAANEDQWTYISDLIDQCDYYILVLGGRYGSTDEEGIGYTQKEYEYAIEKGIPVIAFVHADPGARQQKYSESTDLGRRKFDHFRRVLRTRLYKEWNNPYELGAVVSRSLSQLIKKNPRPGWVRADRLASEESYKEIVRLRNLIEARDKELAHLRVEAPTGSGRLAQGEEVFQLEYRATLSDRSKGHRDVDRHERISDMSSHSWDEIFESFAPYLIVDSRESDIKSSLARLVKESSEKKLVRDDPNIELSSFYIPDRVVHKVIVQFTALGMLEVSSEQTDKKTVRLYRLTALGRRHMMEVSAIVSKKDRCSREG
ncbi:hypothetical protein GCM10007426_43630 [Alloalcanivorax dieselolei]|nr:DUF4062 domain-containing protein [Alloalcanivorax dieselolei]GGK10762.1 hypothetical protein GCM10007426_43630 [Alloalcanivorax dieselolei]